MYNKVKSLSNRKTNSANTALINKDGKVIFEMDDILNRCEEHITELYDDETREKEVHEGDNDMPLDI